MFRVDKNHLGINGKITSGEITKNDTVEILPKNEKYKVLEIQARHVSINNAKKVSIWDCLIKSKNNFIDNGMVISRENDFKLVNEISIQIINVSKINEAILADNSYLFGPI